MRRKLQLPPRFDFRATVFSHGWMQLAPFRWDESASTLSTAVETDGRAVPLKIFEGKGGVFAESPQLSPELVAVARTILNLDLDLDPFYSTVSERPDWRWIPGTGAGRLLRAASLWEDLVKLILTTNCSWALTCNMSAHLVRLYGTEGAAGLRAFPGPERMARVSEEELRTEARVGYRAPSLAKLARLVVDGEARLEDWPEQADRDAEALRLEVLKLPGVGPYVADNVVRLLGRPAGLGLDSFLRARQAEVYHGGRKIKDRTIERRYSAFGRWAGLVLWCDMTRVREEEAK